MISLVSSLSHDGKSYRRESSQRLRAIVADVYSAPRVTAAANCHPRFGCIPGLAHDLSVNDENGGARNFSIPSMRKKAEAMIDAPANEILITSLTSNPGCIADTSVASGAAFKSHRSTNGFATAKTGQATAKWAGESAADYTNPVYAVKINQIDGTGGSTDIFKACKATAAGSSHPYLHLAYIQPDRFNEGSNYGFADGHAKWFKLGQTLDPNNYMWGKKLHPGGNKDILNPDTDAPLR